MNTVTSFVTAVKNNYNTSQPWLETRNRFIPRRNPSSALSQSILRRGQHGGIRNAGISSMVDTCERRLAHAFMGVSSYKIEDTQSMNTNKFGSVLNEHIDSIIRKEEAWVVGNDAPVPNAKPWEMFGSVSVPAPRYQKADGTSRSSFFGVWDYFNTDSNEVLELKCIPEGLPEVPFEKGLRQLAIYICATGASGGWLLYMPANLDRLEPEDESTYRSFYLSAEEAQEISVDVREKVERVIWKMNWRGNNDMPYLSPSWFYYIVKSAPECSEPFCCETSSAWHTRFKVLSNWSVTPR